MKTYSTKLSLAQLEKITASAEWSAKFSSDEKQQQVSEALLKLLRPGLEFARFTSPAEITLTIESIQTKDT